MIEFPKSEMICPISTNTKSLLNSFKFVPPVVSVVDVIILFNTAGGVNRNTATGKHAEVTGKKNNARMTRAMFYNRTLV